MTLTLEDLVKAPRSFVPVALVALTPILTLGLAACAKDATPAGTGSAAASGGASGATSAVSLVKPGTLLVCTHSGFKPFEYPEGGKIVGFDVDLADLVSKKLGVTTEIVDIAFDQITSGAAFAAKKCDLAAAGMTITDTRKAAIGISDPYFNSTQAVLVKKGAGVTELAGLKGKTLAVQTDTTGKIYAEKNAAANGYTTKVFDDSAATANAVKAGKTDASINDNFVMYNFVKGNPDTEVAFEVDTNEKYGLATALTNTGLLKVLNEVLATAKSDGSYDTIYTKWIGTAPTK